MLLKERCVTGLAGDALPTLDAGRPPFRRPRVVDLFAGAGGLSLGLEQAGFDIAAAVEYDPVHCATHEFNFPYSRIVCRDVASLSPRALAESAGLTDSPDVICGGPPCQGFSTIGKRALDDPRNALPREFIRLVHELRPKYVLFENVPGLAAGAHARILQEIVTAFGDAGYVVALPVRVLVATSFGVPQARRRLFILASRRDMVAADYPAPTHASGEARPLLSDLPTCPTVADALDDVPDADGFCELLEDDCVRCDSFGPASDYAASLRYPESDPHNRGYQREWDRAVLSSSLRTQHTPESRQRFLKTPCGCVEPVSRFLKLDPHGYCNTLRAGTGSERGAFTSPRPIHYRFVRCITNREAARLHSYPDWFRFHVTKWHGFRQIGNSVPPLMARAIAARIAAALGMPLSEPVARIALGNPRLLHFTMTEACQHYGVSRAIPSRVRES